MLVGVEHEFVVSGESGRVAFRQCIHGLGLPRPHLDPGDLNSYRLRSGAALTCDGHEAEIALPPLRASPAEIEQRTAAARRELDELLPRGWRLTGYSTHLSVQVASPGPVARLYSRTFAPALALLIDGQASPGLLIRPRAGRLELCGEYVDGLRLRAAVAFAGASVTACASGIVPPKVGTRLQLDDHRHGWYVDRHSYGTDLYGYGRATPLHRTGGGTITAQEHLELCWMLVRDRVGEGDAYPIDLVLRGELPLPCEQPLLEMDRPAADLEPCVFARILERHSGRDFDLAPVMATWDVTVFIVVSRRRERRAFACIPREHFESFLRGDLDGLIADSLARPSRGRKLLRHSQTVEPGVWDELGPRRNLLPVERGPHYQRRRRLIRAHLLTPPGLRLRRGLRGWTRALVLGA